MISSLDEYPAVIPWTNTHVYDTITGSTVGLDDARWTLLQEHGRIPKQKFAAITDPSRPDEFRRYGEWIAVNRQKFDKVWSREAWDMLAEPGIWEKLTDGMQFTDLTIATFGSWSPNGPKPVEMLMHYPQTGLLQHVGRSIPSSPLAISHVPLVFCLLGRSLTGSSIVAAPYNTFRLLVHSLWHLRQWLGCSFPPAS